MLKEVLTVSALIAVVLLVRAIFKNRVPKRMIYALWLVVLLKLCLPGTLFSLPVLPAEEVTAPVNTIQITQVEEATLPAVSNAPTVQAPSTPGVQSATGFPGTRNCETGCKAVGDGTDFSNCLVRRQRIARTLAARRVGSVYDSSAP